MYFCGNDEDFITFMGGYLKQIGMSAEDFIAKVKAEQNKPKPHRYSIEYSYTIYDGDDIVAWTEEEALKVLYQKFSAGSDIKIESIEDEGEVED